MNSALSDYERILFVSEKLAETLQELSQSDDLGVLARNFAFTLRRLGIPVTRLQLPISEMFGLRHPFYMGIIITWTIDEGVTIILRERHNVDRSNTIRVLSKSPYAPLLFEDKEMIRVIPKLDDPYEMIGQLAQKGFTDYLAFKIQLPDGAAQVMSLATQKPEGLGEQVEPFLLSLRPLFAMCLFAAYQLSATRQVAATYLGEHAGNKVLNGEFYRGNAEELSTLILFADIRNFTALSEYVGAETVISYINQIFERLSGALKPLGGEILKFIGDATLIIFPNALLEDAQLSIYEVLRALVNVIQEVRQIEVNESLTLDIGVGLHIGEVSYGNIGTPDRLDFTVMGPAVNLASRLESLNKPLNMSIIFSESVAHQLSPEDHALISSVKLPAQRVKGIAESVEVWGVSIP